MQVPPSLPTRQVLPVIHHLDWATSVEQADIAFAAGADGVFLISHTGDDDELFDPAHAIKAKHPGKRVGLNLLSTPALTALLRVAEAELDMVWADHPGVSSRGYAPEGLQLAHWLRTHPNGPTFFGSVAFKYQPAEPAPGVAAVLAQQAGMLPTTSGPRTGEPPSLEKALGMRTMLGTAPLAVASGMALDNVAAYLPYFTHYLVATGVSRDAHHFDPALLTVFVQVVRGEATT